VATLKSGDLVIVRQQREHVKVCGRRMPRSWGGGNPALGTTVAERIHNIVVCDIPNGARVLYMASQRDGLQAALAGRSKGPYGFRLGDIVYHLVLFGERPVWVSSLEAGLVPIDGS
jgi:hypothetical protein